MPKETFYRFELAFSGEEQDVGILQGLDDTPLPPSVIEELYHYFDSLHIPPTLETQDDSAVVFLFTEKGVREFADSINALIYELSSCDWQVICMSFQLDPEYSLFQDEYQIAYSRTDLLELMWPSSFNYRAVNCISSNEAESLISYVSSSKPTLEQMVNEASARSQNENPQSPSKSHDLDFPVK